MEAVKKIGGAISLVLLTLFAACVEEQSGGAYTAYTPREIAEAIIAAQEEIAPLNALTPDSDYFWEYLAERYLLSEIEILDGIIFYAGGVIVDEIAVLVLACDSDAPAARTLLADYANRRRVIFASYAPAQAGILANSIAAARGNHVALLVTEDPQGAEAAFFALFGDTPPPRADDEKDEIPPREEEPLIQPNPTHVEEITPAEEDPPAYVEKTSPRVEEEPPAYVEETSPPVEEEPPAYVVETSPPVEEEPPAYVEETSPRVEEEPPAYVEETSPREEETHVYEETPPQEEPAAPPARDRYNADSILLAWESGDTSGLTPLNARVLEKSEYVLNSIITDGMDELDKKFAALRWIILNSVYDPEFLSNSPTAAPNPNNDNPYGILVDGVAICFGFAYTFQLFMDLLGIECITVHGYDFTHGRHVWNLVHIDGIWSAVDPTLEVTLNNPLGVEIGFVPEEVVHRHVNLSCDYLYYERGHMWDRDSVPVAVGR